MKRVKFPLMTIYSFRLFGRMVQIVIYQRGG